MSDAQVPGPAVNHESAPFWSAVQGGQFQVGHCPSCGRNHWYPRSFCPFCFAAGTRLIPASGRGTIYSYSVTRLSKRQHVVAYVTLAEGPTMLTNIVDCATDAIAVGLPVRLVFKPGENGIPVPMFTLDTDATT